MSAIKVQTVRAKNKVKHEKTLIVLNKAATIYKTITK
jgi:hypothetical protein